MRVWLRLVGLLGAIAVSAALAGCDPGDSITIYNDCSFPLTVGYTQTYKAFGGPLTTEGHWGSIPPHSMRKEGKVAHQAPFTVIARNPKGVVVGTVVCPVKKPRQYSIRFGPELPTKASTIDNTSR
ncbi:MAG TPA: hypothetical protein VGM37_14245 [Armatimonadota bacterium]|jgi:hypothetical protein